MYILLLTRKYGFKHFCHCIEIRGTYIYIGGSISVEELEFCNLRDRMIKKKKRYEISIWFASKYCIQIQIEILNAQKLVIQNKLLKTLGKNLCLL